MARAGKLRALKEQFKAFDTSGDGKLDFGEMSSLLRRGNPKMTDGELRALFNGIDKNRDGTVDFDEFVDYIYSASEPADSGPRDVDGAKATFLNFAGGGSHLDGKSLAKLCKDAGLTGSKLTATDVDLIFAKVKFKGERTIGFPEFEKALGLIAEKKGTDVASIYRTVAETGGPKLQGTSTDAVRFYDDKSTFTGVAAKGSLAMAGATIIDGGSREVSPMRERPVSRGPARPEPRSSETTSRPHAPRASAEEAPPDTSEDADARSLEEVFRQFCGRNPDMDGKDFAKTCKDAGLLDRKFTTTDADLIFSKVVPRGQRRIGFAEFNKALGLISEKKGCPDYVVQAQMAACGGPVLRGTQAEAVRFHDDKTTYTGMYQR